MAAPGVAEADPPPRLTVAVDDLGAGLWGGKIKQELEARVPLRNVLFSLSRAVVSVEELPIRYLDARGDAQLQRLRQLSHSPVAWFRSPLVHIVLASCGEYEDYKRDLRLRLKAMADTETAAPGQAELLFVFMRPVGADPAAKGPARVFDTMRKDLNRKRDRCVRLDPLPAGAPEPGTPAVLGLEEFDRQLRDALRAGFEARATAYTEEVRRLMLNRLDPSWSFSTLFLVKDGLAAMLEGAGLLEDALREYSELEAVYLEAAQSGTQPRQAFGGKAAGDDEAVMMWASWTATRQAASQPELPPQWVMRQALFASQSRLLLKLHRHAEVAERGLAFARSFGALLARQQRSGSVPAQLREAWSFAAYVSLAAATSRLQVARAEEKRKVDARGGGRRTSAAAVQPPGSPTTNGGADSLPIPIPLSPSALGITSLQVKIASSSEAEGPGSPVWQLDSQQPQLDWQLGALPSWGAAAATAATAGGEAGRGREGGTVGSANLYCLLGKLYCGARAELLRMGAAAGMDLPKSAAAAGLPELPSPQQPQPPPAPPAAAVLPPPSEVTSVQAEESEGTLAGGPSATDLAQLDLEGVRSGSSDPTQQQQQQQQPAGVQGADASDVCEAAEVKLESAAEGQEGEAVAAAATPRQVSPALQRLTVRPKTATDAESADSSPRSTSTHHSSVQQTPREAQSDAGHAVALSMSAAAASAVQPTLLSEQNDMRTAERQVVSALTERSSRSTLAKAAAMAALGATGPTAAAAAAEASLGGTALPPWLVHWRLRAALSSQQLFNELFIELSEAAAKCYSQCGYLRNAAMLRADVADALAKAGSMHRAADLYERQCRTFLREGWHALAAATLPKLAACQLASGSAGLAHTAAAMLSLPAPFGGNPTQRQAACQLLLQAAQLPGGLSSSQPLLPTSPSAAGAPSIEMSAILTAAPPRVATSRFFGRCGPEGEPLLLPPRREACTAGGGSAGSVHGALSAAVGDALPVHLEVHNRLPVALRLQDVVLTLAVLQEMTVIHSPRTSPSPTLAAVPATPRRAPSNPATPLGGDAHTTSEPAESSLGGRERFEPHWQQVEELSCSLVAIRPSGGSCSSRGGSDGPTLQPLRGEVAVPPGASMLTFLAAPVHRGLYQAVHLRARLHNLPLFAAVQQPQPAWRQQQHDGSAPSAALHARGGPGAAHRRQSSRAGGPRGQPLTPLAGGTPLSPSAPRPSQDTPAGMRDAEEIVLFVEQAQARVQLSLVAAGGSLIAGQEQWLGLAVAPERDALHGARLELTWPLANAAGGLAGLPPLPRKLTPSLGSFHRAAHSVGGDIRLSPANSSAKVQPTTQPFIRPEHHAAVLLPASGAAGQQAQQQYGKAGQGGQPQLLPVEGPSGPAASWMLNDEMQHLALPLIEEGRPVSLWWRVTAGEVPMPPEPVHVAPPAPRHSARQHDARRLAGLPVDGVPPPAALLDLPASLEYASGCQRSHCRMLAAPVRQPFNVASAARELPAGGMVVQFMLTSNLAVPAQLASLALEPQPGFVVTTNLLESMGLLPTTLMPAGSLTASFLLAPDPPSGGPGCDLPLLPAKLQPSVLAVEYSFDIQQQCGIAAAPLTPQQQQQHGSGREAKAVSGSGGGSGVAADAAGLAAARQQGQQGQQGWQQQQQTPDASVLKLLSSSSGGSKSSREGAGGSDSPTAVAEEGGADVSAGDCQLCSFRHLLTLEMPASEEATTGTLLFVRLLGPFSAAVGQPTTLCWRLERGGQPDQQHPAARISFEVQAESDHWRPLGRRLGGVTLAGHSGAVATVEATWVPLAAGMLPVPALRLQDVNFQEVFDVGLSGSSSIMVVEAAAGT